MTRRRAGQGWARLAWMAAVLVACAGATRADDADWEHLSQRAAKLYEDGRFDEGLIAAEEALRAAEQSPEAKDFRLAESLTMLAAYYRHQGRTMAADVLDQRALAVQREVFVERRLGFPMQWSYGETDPQWPAARHVVLRFIDYPDHVVGIYSRDLWQSLEAAGGHQVYVTFSLSYDTDGRMRRYQIMQIGNAERWQEEFRYAGAESFGGPSPWDLPQPSVADADAAEGALDQTDASPPPPEPAAR